jgi:hypothetical protein
MGIEIRTFVSLKDLSGYVTDILDQYKMLYEDYSQWLGSLLRSCEEAHKDEEWYKISAALQKTLRGAPREAHEAKRKSKDSGKGKKAENSCWLQSGNVLLSSSQQGQVEVLFEAIEKISAKIVEADKSRVTLQQLERIGLGKNVNYIVYFEDDVPKRIVLCAKVGLQGDEAFRFAIELSVPSVSTDFGDE